MSSLEVDKILNDLKRKQLKKISEDELELASDYYSDETSVQSAEDAVMNAVEFALPEERQRIMSLLKSFPSTAESKVEKLINALGVLWKQNIKERVVIFATYLGTVELIADSISNSYPEQGIVVLKGGDHGSKSAAEKRFKQINGPRVMICTAAGREGINLQHARILFNFDLPWNPMDMEQRIGRIHRYGQKDTAQVYNLVLGDTIEGKIFLLLEDKLKDIGKALGKVDETGNIAEDLKSQILGQLQEKINYQKLYAEALGDPSLHRTQLELNAAMSNAAEARTAVSELFQNLEQFNMDEYTPFSNIDKSMNELIDFVRTCAELENGGLINTGEHFSLKLDIKKDDSIPFSISREEAIEDENFELLGLDHPIIESWILKYRNLPAEEIGCSVKSDKYPSGILSIWEIETHNEKGYTQKSIIKIGSDLNGNRLVLLERNSNELFKLGGIEKKSETNILPYIEKMLEREVEHRINTQNGKSYSAKLIAWIDVTGNNSILN